MKKSYGHGSIAEKIIGLICSLIIGFTSITANAAALPTSPTNYYGQGALNYGATYGVDYTNLPNSYVGNNLINKIFVGTQAIRQAFIGAAMVWVDTYNYNFSINGSNYRVSIPYGENVFSWVAPPNVTMGGYTFQFIGWSTTPTATAPNLGTTFTSGTEEEKTFYAIYSLTRTVTSKVVPRSTNTGMGTVSGGNSRSATLTWYYVNSSIYTGVQNVSMYPSVSAYILASAKSGYKFTSWSVSSGGGWWPGYGNAYSTYGYASFNFAYNSPATQTAYFDANWAADRHIVYDGYAVHGTRIYLGPSSVVGKTFYMQFNDRGIQDPNMSGKYSGNHDYFPEGLSDAAGYAILHPYGYDEAHLWTFTTDGYSIRVWDGVEGSYIWFGNYVGANITIYYY